MPKTPVRKEDGTIVLLESLLSGDSSAAILGQEARGQTSFVGSDTLPTDISMDDKKVLESVGVKFLGTVQNDPMFQYVELPAGWKKAPTDHSMWSSLLDEKGRKRASIFYKAAFYDRSAHLRTERRYGIEVDYDRIDSDHVAVANVIDGTKVLHSTSPIDVNPDKRWESTDKARELATEWLEQNYPDWENSAAYWD